MATTSLLTFVPIAALLGEVEVAAAVELEDIDDGAIAVGLGRLIPDSPLAVRGPGTVDAEAPWPTRKPTDC